MWQAQGKPFDATRFEPFEPVEVLYAFDGPRIFTLWDADDELNLAYWSDGDDRSDRYVVVPTTEADIDTLKAGGASVYDVLAQTRCWACDVTFDGRVARCLRVEFDGIPRDALPAAGTLLLPTLGPVETSLARRRVELAVRDRTAAPTALKWEGRIGQFDWDRLSFDLREVDGGKPDQEFVFGPDLFDDVVRLAQEQVRVSVAGLTFPGRPIAYASRLSRL